MILRAVFHLKKNTLTSSFTSAYSSRRLFSEIRKPISTKYNMSNEGFKSDGQIPDDKIEIIEGTARMLYDKKEAVFYNKVQVFNRDVSIQVISLFGEVLQKERDERYATKLERYQTHLAKNEAGKTLKEPYAPPKGIKILDALAATGLRSIRYLKEIPTARHVTINDLLPDATAVAIENCKNNNVELDKVEVQNSDACLLMYQKKQAGELFDVIDLDPYGSASPFLDAAVQAVADGGLLCVTCTDMAVLSGNYPEVCFAKYGSIPLRADYFPEMALRTLLHAIESAATKYKRHIEPWLSLSVDFYIRVFVRVYESPAEVKNSCVKRILVHQSIHCPSFYIQKMGHLAKARKPNSNESNYNAAYATLPTECRETGSNLRVGGPFWGEAIHKQEVVDEILRRVESNSGNAVVPTRSRVVGVLTAVSEELKDVPFYYNLSSLASAVHLAVPTNLQMHSALINAGYRVSQFHHEPMAVKTDAPDVVVWDIIREYCKQFTNKIEPSKRDKKNEEHLLRSQKILSKEVSTKIDFTVPKELMGEKKKVARFAPNPEAFWGPKRRAGKLLKENQKSASKSSEEVIDSSSSNNTIEMEESEEPVDKKMKSS